MKKLNHKKSTKDHLGNQYDSISEMCAIYNIEPETFSRRIKVYGWSLKDALTRPVKKNGGQYCYDHNGTRYKSHSLMCQAYNIDRKTFEYRIKHGYSIEEALTKPARIANNN